LTAFLVCGFGYADQLTPWGIGLVALGAMASTLLLVHRIELPLVTGLSRLINASATQADLGVVQQLEVLARHVIAEMLEEEASLFRDSDDLGHVVGRWSTRYQLALEERGVRPSFAHRQVVNRFATRLLNRCLQSPPIHSPPASESTAPPRVDTAAGGLS
jgi:hypothetical protein